jgi:hypothetical protein
MALENNPLKQYFRRPAVYVRLPSQGKYYSPAVLDMPENQELPIFPMTAIDEITTKTPDALFNGSAMVELIKSCVPNIKEPWSINSMDVDAILIGIRAASNGAEMEIESSCPACDTIGKYGLNLVAMLAQMKPGNYDESFEITDLKIKFRPLTYREMNEASIGQLEIQRMFMMLEQEPNEELRTEKSKDTLKKVTELTMRLLTGAIEYIETPNARVDDKTFIADFLRNCDKNLFVSIRDHNADLRSQTEIKPFKIKCVNCTHEYDQPFTLNSSDFFE